MAITARTSGALAVSATTGPITPALPAGTVEGDVCHLSVRAHSATATPPTINTPTNWTLLQTGTVVRGGTESVRHSVFRRVVPSGGMSAPSVSSSGSDGLAAVISGYSGADITTPEDVAVPAASTGAALSPLPAPSVTTVTPGALVVSYYNQLDDRTLSAPNNGATLLYAVATLTGSDTCMAGATKAMPTAGASGVTSITSDAPQAFEYVNHTVAIRPASTTQDKAASDTLTVAVTDTLAELLRDKAASDTLTVAVTDTASVAVPIQQAGADTLTVAVTDTVVALDRYTMVSPADTLTVGITDEAVRTTQAPVLGSWVSPPVALPEEPLAGSLFYYRAVVPPGCTLLWETSIDNGASWQEAANKGPVPGLPVGSASVPAVLVRAIMSRPTPETPSPELHRLELRVATDSSRDEWVQLGRFRLQEAEVIDSAGGVTVRLSGSDVSRNIARNTWDESLVIPAGTNVRDAIITIITNRWPDATFNLPSTEFSVPRLFYGPGIGSGNPWADVRKVAREGAGWELFPDAYGVITGRPVPDPDTQPSVFTFSDSQHPTMTALNRRMTDQDTYNQVIAIAQSTSIEEAVFAVWQDTDPASKTRIDGDYGVVTKTIRTDKAASAEQCQAVADAEGRAVKGATEVVRISALCAGFLDPGDVVEVDRERSKTTGRFLTDGWHIDLGPEAMMSLNTRRQRA